MGEEKFYVTMLLVWLCLVLAAANNELDFYDFAPGDYNIDDVVESEHFDEKPEANTWGEFDDEPQYEPPHPPPPSQSAKKKGVRRQPPPFRPSTTTSQADAELFKNRNNRPGQRRPRPAYSSTTAGRNGPDPAGPYPGVRRPPRQIRLNLGAIGTLSGRRVSKYNPLAKRRLPFRRRRMRR